MNEQIKQRIAWAWPEANPTKDILIVGPIGSRQDYLLFNRKTREVSTGVNGSLGTVCFKGSLYSFELAVRLRYHNNATLDRQHYADYEAAIAFLKAISGVVDEEPIAHG